jgi:hypothetical protein
MNARYYSPYINRFISADTIVPDPADPQSFNRYSYTYNNPLKYIDPSGHNVDCSPASFDCSQPLPTWWTDGTRRVFVEGYGVFDLGHIDRGYRSAQFFKQQTELVLANGGGQFNKPAESDGGFLRSDYEVFYSVSGNVSADQVEGVMYGMYIDFELGYEAEQAGRIDFYSAFAPEDLPSDHLGYWAYINGRHSDEIPGILESLGEVTPWQGGSLLTDVIAVPRGGSVGIVRNHEFTPMAPLTIDHGRGVYETRWQNTPWPAWLEIMPVGSGPNTWHRVD